MSERENWADWAKLREAFAAYEAGEGTRLDDFREAIRVFEREKWRLESAEREMRLKGAVALEAATTEDYHGSVPALSTRGMSERENWADWAKLREAEEFAEMLRRIADTIRVGAFSSPPQPASKAEVGGQSSSSSGRAPEPSTPSTTPF